jgi:hypothetical protein
MNEHEKTAVAADAVLLWRSGVDIESLVKFMRERGLSQEQSTEVLTGVARLDAIKAQIAVIHSEAWRDQYQRNAQLNQQFIDALIQLGEESGDSTITETELDKSLDLEIILHSTIAT